MENTENIYQKIRAMASHPEYSGAAYETHLCLYAFAEAISADDAVRVASDEVHVPVRCQITYIRGGMSISFMN
jgi:hypothetical protein